MNLEKLINLEDVTLDLDSTNDNGEKAKDIFCDYWPTTKAGLETTILIVKNPIVKGIIRIIIAVGDGISKKLCI